MSYHETETISIECPELKQTVELALNYLYIQAEQASSPVTKRLTNFDCSDKERCSVSKQNKDGAIDCCWKNCPHHETYRQ